MALINSLKSYNLSEAAIRYAMENTRSCGEAANWLHVNYFTFRKYARQYTDSVTGLTLLELQKLKWKTLPRAEKRQHIRIRHGDKHFKTIPVEKILSGEHKNYSLYRLQKRLIKESYLKEECYRCGYCEHRDTDYQVPLRLYFKDHDVTNLKLENLYLLCHNCYYHVALPYAKKNKPKLL